MFPFRSAFFRTIRQVLALLLVFSVGLQGLPVHTLVQSVQNPRAHHECSHAQGYCPMNPDGPCQCDHNSTDLPEEPTVQSCSGTASVGVLTVPAPKWRSPSSGHMPALQARPVAYPPSTTTLSSQRMGDDVFRPPRVQAADRPGSTLQAVPFA